MEWATRRRLNCRCVQSIIQPTTESTFLLFKVVVCFPYAMNKWSTYTPAVLHLKNAAEGKSFPVSSMFGYWIAWWMEESSARDAWVIHFHLEGRRILKSVIIIIVVVVEYLISISLVFASSVLYIHRLLRFETRLFWKKKTWGLQVNCRRRRRRRRSL